MKKMFLMVVLSAVCCQLHAASLKVDIDGRANKIRFAVSKCVNCRGVFAAWAKELKQSYLCIDGVVRKEWKRYSFTFTPDKDGTVTLSVRGNYKKAPAADWIAYDDFKVSGAVLKNGSFEEVQKGVPAFWSAGRYGYITGKTVDGKRYVASSHNNFLRQNIEVRKDVPVTVEFSACFDRSTTEQFHPQAPVYKH